MTPAVTRAGAAVARSLLGRNIRNRSSCAYLTAITTDGALFEPRGLRLYTTEALPGIAHEIHEAEPSVEYVNAAINVQSCSVREKSEIIPNTFKQAMTLLGKLERKAGLR